jgi:hypothetical protein
MDMKSYIRNSLMSNSISGNKCLRNKRLALILLISFCLTYMGQAFAIPMVCMMPAAEVADSKASLPCHHSMVESDHSTQPITETGAETGTMTCCDQMNSDDANLTMSTHDCACPDGGYGATLMLISSFSCNPFKISEQPYSYSTMGFPNQIDAALFRPPIA